jgi:hypothetical protein
MIHDADLTMPPEELPKFYTALCNNKGEFVNGCRLVYPMDKNAMRSLNLLGNKFFGWFFLLSPGTASERHSMRNKSAVPEI